MSAAADKQITGYCEPWSVRAGEAVNLFASSLVPCTAKLDLVRIVCGDISRSGPGFKEIEIPSQLPASVELPHQPLVPGSFATFSLAGLTFENGIEINFCFLATVPDRDQPLIELAGTEGPLLKLAIRRGHLVMTAVNDDLRLTERAIVNNRWYEVSLTLRDSTVDSVVTARLTRGPGLDYFEDGSAQVGSFDLPESMNGDLATGTFAADSSGGRFDGRVARPRITLDSATLKWDFAHDMASATIHESSDLARHAILHQLPARAVTGPDWDSSTQNWQDRPEHYDAIHFHSDDLYDAGWMSSDRLELPVDLASGIYAFRLRSEQGEDRIPFFVRPSRGNAANKTALLMSTCTYMAYANHRMLFEGADFVAARARLRPEHAYVRDHRELGLSCYEKHSDGSGVMFSSRRRPVLQVRPGADGWNFTPDTVLNAFLEHLEIGHDIVTDEDLHFEGTEALDSYRVIVTSTHPEYWSTNMLDALETWQRKGGRLLYLGGNGFYWRVAFSDDWPGAIELRRAEDGVRNWQCEPGEYYHAFGGEYGGLWRRLGRPPNQIAGIGFTAQGFERATYFQRTAESYNSRASWIFNGVEEDRIGTSGLGGGAAGQEIDRFDPSLGSPPHALVLATATEFGPDMVRVKEEFEGSVFLSPDDPLVRADIVFYETPGNGAVFSVGSISWFGALARENYRNDVAQITENVIRRFIDPAPFTELESHSQTES